MRNKIAIFAIIIICAIAIFAFFEVEKMNYEVLENGQIGTNSVFVYDDNELIIFDPSDFETIDKRISRLNKKLKAIYLTHGHWDHIGAVFGIVEKYGVPVYMNKADMPLLDKQILDMFHLQMPEVNFFEEGPIDFGGEIYFMPGHTMGSSIFYFKDLNLVVGGDFIFRQSIGRTDLPFSSDIEMKKSLEKFKKIDCGNAVIIPGHGEKTTIDYEVRNNYYIKN